MFLFTNLLLSLSLFFILCLFLNLQFLIWHRFTVLDLCINSFAVHTHMYVSLFFSFLQLNKASALFFLIYLSYFFVSCILVKLHIRNSSILLHSLLKQWRRVENGLWSSEETDKQIREHVCYEKLRRLKEARNEYREEVIDCVWYDVPELYLSCFVLEQYLSWSQPYETLNECVKPDAPFCLPFLWLA